MTDAKPFLVVLDLKGRRRTEAELKRLKPMMEEVMARISSKKPEIVFSSFDVHVFGYFILSNLKSGQIHTRLRSPDSPQLQDGDGLLVFELGSDFATHSGSRAGAWLRNIPR